MGPREGQRMSADETREVAAESAEGLDRASEPCWYPETTDGQAFEWGEGTPHWQSEGEGGERLASILAEYDDAPDERPALALRRESEACWHLTCAECGYRYDEDEWACHFPSRAEAERAAQDCDWHVSDGRLLCPDCYLSEPPPADGEA